MLGEKRRGITDAARELGIEPFEVVRLLVAADKMPEQLEISDELLETIRSKGGIESWWLGEAPPEDEHRQRGWLRAGLQRLLDSGYVGDRGVRMDNLWRGLPLEDQDAIQQGLNLLIDEGHLQSVNTEAGVLVSVDPKAQEAVGKTAKGIEAPAALAALWG